jgi:hypothetical protein
MLLLLVSCSARRALRHSLGAQVRICRLTRRSRSKATSTHVALVQIRSIRIVQIVIDKLILIPEIAVGLLVTAG